MSALTDVVRFFRVVAPVHPLIVGALAAAVGIAGVAVMVDVGQAGGALVLLFLLQALATSSGFAGPARRGHYDLLLTTGRSRVQIALVHWVISAGPGLAAWTLIVIVESIARQGWPVVSLSAGTLTALVLASTLPWAATVRLPRLTGGLGWILLFAVVATTLPAGYRDTFSDVGGRHGLWATLIAVLACPWTLVGRDLAATQGVSVAAAGLVALAAMGAAVRWVHRADFPLEAGQ